MAVYFIRAGRRGAIKIGWSKSATRRLRMLQTASPHSLSLIGTIPADAGYESYLHHKFAHLHIRGEWFRPTQELLDFISGDHEAEATAMQQAAEQKRETVRAALRSSGLSTGEIARESGVCQSTVSEFMRAVRQGTSHDVERFSTVLGLRTRD